MTKNAIINSANISSVLRDFGRGDQNRMNLYLYLRRRANFYFLLINATGIYALCLISLILLSGHILCVNRTKIISSRAMEGI